MEWTEFVGRAVVQVEINGPKDLLIFTFKDGSRIFASATGDCCSTSWFEHVEGLECLIGHKIVEAVERDMPKGIKDEEHDHLQFYGWTLVTSRGRFDIEMRNASNGYYGGSVDLSFTDANDQYGQKRKEIGDLSVMMMPKTDWETPEISENLPVIEPRRRTLNI